MASYEKYTRTLAELRAIGNKVQRIMSLDSSRPHEVDIELTVEKSYGIRIDIAPLKAEQGVLGYPAIGGGKIFIDIGLADADSMERRYRFTLAEELAHVILHKDLYKDVQTVADYFRIYEAIPEDIYQRLDKNAKELAGIILMPEKLFLDRIMATRNGIYLQLGIRRPSEENKSQIVYAVIRQLADNFNVSEEACGIRLERVQRWEGKSFFEL